MQRWRLGPGPTGVGGFSQSCAHLAAGCAAGTYRAIATWSPFRDDLPHHGWHVLPPAATSDLLTGLAVILGVVSAGRILVWASSRELDGALGALAAAWALLGALTGVALQIASSPSWTAAYGRIATGALAFCWLMLAAATYTLTRSHRTPAPASAQVRGCDYCVVDAHLLTGDVQQVAVRVDQQRMLLRCPRCLWLYEMAIDAAPRDARHVTQAQALQHFSARL